MFFVCFTRKVRDGYAAAVHKLMERFPFKNKVLGAVGMLDPKKFQNFPPRHSEL